MNKKKSWKLETNGISVMQMVIISKNIISRRRLPLHEFQNPAQILNPAP